jgi:c-di-GMP phosphodiesterase
MDKNQVNSSNEVLLGRQPIYDRLLKVYAYEILYRSNVVTAEFDGDMATSQVLLRTFNDIGLKNVVGKHPAFINFTRSFLMSLEKLMPFKDFIVIEILEDIKIDEELIQSISKFYKKGYRFALDDVEDVEDVKALLDYVYLVKLEVLGMSDKDLKRNIKMLKKRGIKVLAEKVETHEMYERCKELGADYFQGYFLSKPKILTAQAIAPSKISVLQMISEVNSIEPNVDNLEKIVKQDVTFSFKLLKMINSAFYSIPSEITSVRQALIMLGTKEIRSWIMAFVMTKLDDKPNDLLVTALLRAKFCELLAEKMNVVDSDIYFMTGLLSVLDALIDKPMKTAVSEMVIAKEIARALISRKGDLGRVLSDVIYYERGQWDKIDFKRYDEKYMQETYITAISWSENLLKSV